MAFFQPFHKRSHRTEEDVTNSIAIEAQRIVREAATPVPPGVNIKGQLRLAARALGYPDGHWRIRAAWNLEAGTWSAAAMEDLRQRFENWKQRRAVRALETEAADRDDFKLLSERLSSIEEFLAEINPDVRRQILSSVGYKSMDPRQQAEGQRDPMGALAGDAESRSDRC